MTVGETALLDEVCEVQYGTRVVQKRDGGSIFPVYGGGGATFQLNEFNREDRLVIARFGMSEECARFVRGKFFLNDSGLTVSPKNGKLLPSFLDYQLYSKQDLIYALGKGSAQKNLDVPAFRLLPIFVPDDLKSQRRIVSILDEAFDVIATAKVNASKNLQNASAVFETQLQGIFAEQGNGWKQKTLEQIATNFGRGKSRNRPRNAPHLYGGKYPFIQTGDIRNADHIITEYSQTYSEAGLAQSKLWPKGTICITIAANIAETAILGFDACFPDSVIGVVANPKEAEVDFVEYLLQAFKVRLQAMGKGSAQDNINMGTFESQRFPFPPVAEQREIVKTLNFLREETQNLESIYQRKLAALDELKQSLLHQAFSGAL